MVKKLLTIQTLIVLFFISTSFHAIAVEATNKIDAVTGNGEKVILFSDGHWEFVDQQKAAVAKEVAKQEQQQQKADADCPPEARDGLFGCLLQGDKGHHEAPHGKVYHSPM